MSPHRKGADDDETKTLTTLVHARLREDILSGYCPPGSKLKMEDLRQRYGVGASPLREALNLLTSEDLVERLEQRGFRVHDITVEECIDLFRTRCWVEERILRDSIARGGKEWEDEVIFSFRRLSGVSREVATRTAVGRDEWERRHDRFHFALVSASVSPLVMRYWRQLYDKSIRYRRLARLISYPGRDVAREHEEILHAVLARDADLAAARMVDHYGRTVQLLNMKLFALPQGMSPNMKSAVGSQSLLNPCRQAMVGAAREVEKIIK